MNVSQLEDPGNQVYCSLKLARTPRAVAGPAGKWCSSCIFGPFRRFDHSSFLLGARPLQQPLAAPSFQYTMFAVNSAFRAAGGAGTLPAALGAACGAARGW